MDRHKVQNPQLNLTGANDLKVFFDEKPPKPPAEGDKPEDEKKESAGNPFGDFGDANRMVATGAVKIRVTPEDGDPIEASGAILSYSVAEEQLVLSGGYPWVQRQGEDGKMTLFAQEANLSLRIDIKKGQVVTEGKWDTSLPLKRLQQR